MKIFKSHFRFNKQERSGIFFLLFIVVLFQIGYFAYQSLSIQMSSTSFSLDKDMQAKFDILKEKELRADSIKIYPFNPNYITDYKGYTLGMSVEEIDRLHEFRKSNEFINSIDDFQKVTQVSDSLLNRISPYFKFPDWVKKNQEQTIKSRRSTKPQKSLSTSSRNTQIKDLNAVTAEELRAINGVGEKLSQRIIKFRDRLGGFLTEEQVYDVYYLEPEVAKRVLTKFKVFNKPEIEKIDINTATASEISSLVYITYAVAEEIVSHREVNGPFSSLNELENIEGFPINKIERIALYLSL